MAFRLWLPSESSWGPIKYRFPAPGALVVVPSVPLLFPNVETLLPKDSDTTGAAAWVVVVFKAPHESNVHRDSEPR